MNYELYLFDFDGTICATHEAIAHVISRTFAEYGVAPPDEADVARSIGTGIGLSETLSQFNPSLSDAECREWVTTYRRIYNSGAGKARTRLFDGVLDTMRALSARDKPIVVVSNKGELAIRDALDEFGLTPHVSRVVCDTGDVPKKPAPDAYERFIRPHFPHISSDATLVVGDTEADIEFARNIGAASCWARYGYGQRGRCLSRAPDHVIENLQDVLCLGVKRAESRFRYLADLRDARPHRAAGAALVRLLEQFSSPDIPRADAQRLVSEMTRQLLEAEFVPERGRDVVLIPVLRAGLAMWQEASAFFSKAETAFVLCAKDKATRSVDLHWASTPRYPGRTVLVLDTVAATGDTLTRVIEDIRRQSGPEASIQLLSCYAAPDAIAALAATSLDAMTLGVISRTQDAGFLVPRINGDAGDKLYGVKHV